VSGNAFLHHCNGSVDDTNFRYDWRIFHHGVDVTITLPKSISVNPMEFILPGYSLDVDEVYSIVLESTHVWSSKSSTSQPLCVFVEPGDIIVDISGGTTMTLTHGRSLTIDASKSYDENTDQKDEVSPKLVASYTCVTMSPVFQSQRDLSRRRIDPLRMEVTSDYWKPWNGIQIFYMTVTVRNPVDGRSGQTRIKIISGQSSAPILLLTSSFPYSDKQTFNPTERLMLTGYVKGMSECICGWSVEDNRVSSKISINKFLDKNLQFDLDSISRFLLQCDLTSSYTSRIFFIYFFIFIATLYLEIFYQQLRLSLPHHLLHFRRIYHDTKEWSDVGNFVFIQCNVLENKFTSIDLCIWFCCDRWSEK